MKHALVVACLGLAACERSGGTGAGSSGSNADTLITYDPVLLRKVLQDLAGGHVFVLKRSGAFTEYRDVAKSARSIDGDVLAATPFTFSEIMLRHGDRSVGAVLKGVPTERIHSSIEHYVVAGALGTDTGADPSLALGSELATLLGVAVGDHIEIQLSRDPALGIERDSEFRGARVGALLHTNLAEYDYHLAVTNIDASQALIGHGDVVLGIEIALGHETAAHRIATALQGRLGSAGYQVTDWCDLNRPLLGCAWRGDAH